jgi:hypothetical protein
MQHGCRNGKPLNRQYGGIVTHELTIIGDRQSGKTYLMTMMAVEEAAGGGTVWYQGTDYHMDRVNFQNCLERAEWLYKDRIKRAYRSNGAQRIVFTGGGEICFSPKEYGRTFDLHCLDEIPGERLSTATRSVRAVLR